MIKRIVRRWHVIIITALVVCGIAIPVMWFSTGKKFQTTGAIRIARMRSRIPIVRPIIPLDRYFDPDRGTRYYENFISAEAKRIASDAVLIRVADELSGKKLMFFEDSVDPVLTLRQAINAGEIEIATQRGSELIAIKMLSNYPREAEQVVDAFIRSYKAEEGSSGSNKLKVLGEKKLTLTTDIDEKKREINKLIKEFGSSDYSPQQEMMLEVVARIRQDLIGITIQRIALEAKVQLMENDNADPLPNTDKAQRQNAYINSNPVVHALSAEIAHHEVLVAESNGQSGDNDPNLQEKKTLEALNKRLSELQEELTTEFEKRYEAELAQNREIALARAKAELAQAIEHENKLREKLKELDTDTIGIGRMQLNIDDQNEELARTKELYDMVVRRIEEIEFEQDRPARISIAQRASSVPAKDCRLEMSIASVPVGLLLGVLFAGLLGRKKVK